MRVVSLIMICLFLGACGVKPGNTTPPSGEDNTTFPRTYPAPETLD